MPKKKTTKQQKQQTAPTRNLVFVLVLLLAITAVAALILAVSIPRTHAPVSVKATEQTPKKEALNETAVTNLVTTTYNDYLAGLNGTAEQTARAIGVFKQQSTDTVGTYIDATTKTDPILCSKEKPEHLSFSQPTLQRRSALVTVTGEYKDKKKNTTISVYVDRQLGDISYIACVQ